MPRATRIWWMWVQRPKQSALRAPWENPHEARDLCARCFRYCKKGDVIGVARIAAIMASKKTSELIPLCHPIALTHVTVDFELCPETSEVLCTAVCETKGQTGVEMEALTAVEVGLLTVYDMLKAVDRFMEIGGIHLEEKAGGKSGHWVAADTKATFED